MKLNTYIKCPECGYVKMEVLPTDSCQNFYECTNCKSILKPIEGDYCVFCSYSAVNCPSKQKESC